MASTQCVKFSVLLTLLSVLHISSAQHFHRLGACPTLGCVFPPDQSDFYPGQLFDIRLEVHAPVNGREASNGGVPDEKFSFCIRQGKGACNDASKVFKVKSQPPLEKWCFSFFEDLFAQDANKTTSVNVASKIYRAVSLTNGPDGMIASPDDSASGFLVSGTLGRDEAEGVHSLTDVSVFASGPGSEDFRGHYNSIDIFFKMADALGLGDASQAGHGRNH